MDESEMPDTRVSLQRMRRRFLQSGLGLAVSSLLGMHVRAESDDSSASADQVHKLGQFALECGAVLPDAWVAFKTHGVLNSDRSNAILYPTQFAAQHGDIEWMVGHGRALDPNRFFIVVADQLGNGLSSSPSNTSPPFDRMRFPVVSIRDDVAAQYRLVRERLGIRRLALVLGYSMGAQQAYQWAVSHPDMVDRILPFCGTARTTAHNKIFLEGIRSALMADSDWMNGEYAVPPVRGLRALARVYAGWGFSQDFYDHERYRELGFASVSECVSGFWENRYMKRDANNLLSMIRTWELNDVGATPGFEGRVDRALRSIRAKAVVIASQTDLYFRPIDMEAESAWITGARFKVIPSEWGHMAGAGINAADSAFLAQEVRGLLDN